jgi:hypothetical protein
MTTPWWTNNFFTLLNMGVVAAVLYWLVVHRVLPRIRTSLNMQHEETQQLAQDIDTHKTTLTTVQQNYTVQEREIARLTSAIEKWAGVLSQRAATSEHEARELAFRYKARCEDNARSRVLQATHQRVTKQALNNARIALERIYTDPEKQQHFMESVCLQMSGKDSHGTV